MFLTTKHHTGYISLKSTADGEEWSWSIANGAPFKVESSELQCKRALNSALRGAYLDRLNNYLTVDRMFEDYSTLYGIASLEDLISIVDAGRALHGANAKRYS